MLVIPPGVSRSKVQMVLTALSRSEDSDASSHASILPSFLDLLSTSGHIRCNWICYLAGVAKMAFVLVQDALGVR